MNTKKVTILTVVIIFIFTSFARFLPNVEAAAKLPDGSRIAGVLLEDIPYHDAKEILQMEVEKWQAGPPLIAESNYEKVLIPREVFQFDVESSLKELEKKTKRRWSNFFMKQKNVQLPIKVDLNHQSSDLANWPDYIDQDQMLENARILASNLVESTMKIEYKKNPDLLQETIAEVTIPISDLSKASLEYIVKELNEKTIGPESEFSLLQTLSLPESLGDSSKELNLVASALYTLALQTNMNIMERHSQSKLPSYIDPGLDVEVDFDHHKDLVLSNPNSFAYKLQAKVSEKELLLSFSSFPLEEKYEYQVKEQSEIKPRTVYRYDPQLNIGEQSIIDEGKNGLKVEVFRMSLTNDGVLLDQQLMSRDYYPPSPKIVLVSSKSLVTEENADETDDETDDIDDEATPQQDEPDLGKIMEGFSQSPNFNQILEELQKGFFADEIDDEEDGEEDDLPIFEDGESNLFDFIIKYLIFDYILKSIDSNGELPINSEELEPMIQAEGMN